MNAKYLLLSMACLLAACSQDEARQEEPAVALQVSTEMSTTRGVITGTSFTKGDNIAVVVVKQDGNLYEGNRYWDFYEYDGTDWKNSSSWRGDLMLTSEEGVVYACYPTKDGNWIESGCWVSVSPSWSGEQDDYLYGKSIENVSCKNPKARLRFQFALARLTFQIALGGANASAQVLSSVKLGTVPTSGMMDVKTGDITSSQQNYGLITLSVNKTLSAVATTQVDILVIPTRTNIYTTLTLTINSTDYDISIPVTTWEKGKQYTYPVTVNMGSQQQQPEPNKPGEKVYMGFNGDNGKPLYWSSWNLGASSPEGYGDYYAWGELQPKTMFDWSTYTLCNGTAESCSDIGTNICGTKYDVVRNKWGAGWRMPTKNEFQKLLDNCTVSWIYTNGIKGISVKAKNGNTIFLPAAGCYLSNNYNGKPDLINYGFYNTATLAFTYYVTHIVFGETWENGRPYFSAGYRCEGYPIRPVTE